MLVGQIFCFFSSCTSFPDYGLLPELAGKIKKVATPYIFLVQEAVIDYNRLKSEIGRRCCLAPV